MAKAINPSLNDVILQIDHHKRRSLVHMAKLRDSLNQMVSAYEARIAALEEENHDLRKIALTQSQHVADLSKEVNEYEPDSETQQQ